MLSKKYLPIISFDCGHRSLSWTILSMSGKESYLIYKFNFADLTDGKKIADADPRQVAINLKRVLYDLSDIKPKTILIEQQPAFNAKTCSIRDQLIYHFCDHAEIKLMSPSLKNQICFAEELRLSKFIAKSKASTNYSANKSHARANLQKWLELMDPMYYELPTNFSKRICDIADSFLQLIAWYRFNIEIPSIGQIKSGS